MADDIDKMQDHKQQIQDELQSANVSRRNFIDRIKNLGFGFGASVFFGLEGAEARGTPDTAVNLTSTNPALDAILNEAGKAEDQTGPGEKKVQVAWYRRIYRRFGARRFFRRVYRRF
ncbi:MAG: hypothetical protein L0Y57_04040 [Beijerinckiaceae bacterium]|nr:hypothetical protein [Beijerinckiaceae bacterium]